MRKLTGIFTMSLAVCLILCLISPLAAYAVPNITIDDDIYNLYVDEYPDEVTNGIYAKFKSTKANVDDYYLNLSTEDAEETFTKALNSSGIRLTDEQLISPFTSQLWMMTDEDDIKKSDTVEVLCPLPDDAQEHPKDCELYMVTSGKAKTASFNLVVDSDGIYYAQMNFPSYTTYGFVYNDPESYSEEPEEPEDPDEDDYIDEDDPDEDDPDAKKPDIGEPTAEPTATPTPVVTKKPSPTEKPEPTKASSKNSNKKNDSSKKPSPTSKPSNTGNSSKSDSSSKVKDSIPKTGDDFPLGTVGIVGGASAGVFITALILLKKKK